MLDQFEPEDELDILESISGEDITDLEPLISGSKQQQSEHEIYLAQQSALFRQQQCNRRRIEAVIATILCSSLTGNVSLIFIQWGANWLIATLGGCIAGCAVMATADELTSNNSLIDKAKYLIPAGASLFATSDYRELQWQTWIGVKKYQEDMAEIAYGKRDLTQVPDDGLRILIMIASALVLLWVIPHIFKKDDDRLEF